MSPPCLATIFEGDNGGATARGVSATEIRIAIPGLAPSTTNSYNLAVDALFAAMNRNFEFYGRRLVPVYVGGNVISATQARATAAAAAAENVFGGLTGYAEWQAGQQAAASELARQGIVTITRNASTWWTDRTLYDALHPYAWTVNPSSEDIQANMASLACQSLAGHKATNAGDAGLKNLTRRFGIVAVGIETPPTVAALTEALTTCTGQSPMVVSAAGAAWSTQGRAGYERFRDAGVTTVFCVCEGYQSTSAHSSAHTVGYHPEWVIFGGYLGSGNDEAWLQAPRSRNEIAPPIRLGAGPRLLPLQARPWYPILAPLVTPTTAMSALIAPGEVIYSSLLVMASGIQAAGPTLTAETFAAGLMTTQFSNPGAGTAPFWQPSAGFGPGDHSFYDDYNVAWWSDTADALDIGLSTNPKGSWCYLNQAARFQAGGYPANANQLLFNPDVPCR